MPTATCLGMANMEAIAGTASALQRSAQMVVGAAASMLAGLFGESPLVGMTTAMLVFSTLSILLLSAARYTGIRLTIPPDK